MVPLASIDATNLMIGVDHIPGRTIGVSVLGRERVSAGLDAQAAIGRAVVAGSARLGGRAM